MNARFLFPICFYLFFCQLAFSQVGSVKMELLPENATTLLRFNDKSQLQKFSKKLSKYKNLKAVIIENTLDSASTNLLLQKLKKVKSLEVIVISVGSRKTLPKGITGLSQVSTLKVFDSPELDKVNLEKTIKSMPFVKGFSWINNNTPFPTIDLEQFVEIEWFDKNLMLQKRDMDIFSMYENLRTLTFGISNIDSLPSINLNGIEKLNLINYNYCKEWPLESFFFIENETSEEVNLTDNEGKTKLEISYFSEEHKLTYEEKLKLKNSFKKGEFGILGDTFNNQDKGESVQYESNVFHKNKFVKPPIETLIIPNKSFQLETEAGGSIFTETGTIIDIPQDAFIDADGKAVTGPITLSYREFKTPIDILLSGIPMTYDSGGVINQFQSAGMFELYASQNNKELNLKPGKTIEMKFVSTDTSNTYNFYQYSEKDSNWVYKSNADKTQNLVSNNTTPQIARRNRMDSVSVRELYTDSSEYKRLDTTTFDQRYKSLDYYYLSSRIKRKDTVQYFRAYYNRYYKRIIYNEISGRVVTRPSKRMVRLNTLYKDKKDSLPYAKVMITNEYTLLAFPELKVFRNYVFCINGFEKNRQFKEKYVYNKVYNDIRIIYEPGESTGIIELKDKTGFTQIEFEISTPYHRSTKFAVTNFNRLYKRYTKQLAKRERAFDNSNKQKIDRALRYGRKSRFVKVALDSAQLNDTSFYNGGSAVGYNTGGNSLYRSLSLSGLGIYNCDQIYRLSNPQTRTIVLLDSNGKRRNGTYTSYVLDEKLNGVLSYYGPKVTLQPKNTRIVMAIVASGAANIIYTAVKDSIPKDSSEPIELRQNTTPLRSLQDFFDLFGTN
jgi:hypothetical protein